MAYTILFIISGAIVTFLRFYFRIKEVKKNNYAKNRW